MTAAGPGGVLVTGGSRGIGAATALLAARKGHSVCLSYRGNAEKAAAIVSRIEADGGTAMAIRAEISDEASVMALFAEAGTLPGGLRYLVNNAGMLEPQMRLEAMSADRIARVMAVNVTGALICAREAVKRFSTRHGGPGGAIVNVSSMAARLGSPNEYIDYAASKGAIDAMTIGLAKEVAGEGIRVNAVRPGLIETDIHAAGGEPGRVERLASSVPMGRGGQAEEVAEAICWLLSDAASYVTGSFIDVSGGR